MEYYGVVQTKLLPLRTEIYNCAALQISEARNNVVSQCGTFPRVLNSCLTKNGSTMKTEQVFRDRDQTGLVKRQYSVCRRF